MSVWQFAGGFKEVPPWGGAREGEVTFPGLCHQCMVNTAEP